MPDYCDSTFDSDANTSPSSYVTAFNRTIGSSLLNTSLASRCPRMGPDPCGISNSEDSVILRSPAGSDLTRLDHMNVVYPSPEVRNASNTAIASLHTQSLLGGSLDQHLMQSQAYCGDDSSMDPVMELQYSFISPYESANSSFSPDSVVSRVVNDSQCRDSLSRCEPYNDMDSETNETGSGNPSSPRPIADDSISK
ncbi:unnamed protein product [Protopolystoma xenopodis]|uniref:Uncharacterized protein n=1 Tax=Protopolystoma xenopodis TaxID=117903 RepID=A0A448WIB4_9PLAT|nr:unnamed protein product [Protopolystoma xenopodis]